MYQATGATNLRFCKRGFVCIVIDICTHRKFFEREHYLIHQAEPNKFGNYYVITIYSCLDQCICVVKLVVCGLEHAFVSS